MQRKPETDGAQQTPEAVLQRLEWTVLRRLDGLLQGDHRTLWRGAGLDLAGREGLVRRLSELAADPMAPSTILVTHHLEEIPPGFTHALLLREGGIVAQGAITDVLTEENLSTTFGLPLAVSSNAGRYTATARS